MGDGKQEFEYEINRQEVIHLIIYMHCVYYNIVVMVHQQQQMQNYAEWHIHILVYQYSSVVHPTSTYTKAENKFLEEHFFPKIEHFQSHVKTREEYIYSTKLNL